MVESGTTFNHKGQRWEVLKYDSYEDSYICYNLDSHNFQKDNFKENQILGGQAK